jgi:hypothetical protein
MWRPEGCARLPVSRVLEGEADLRSPYTFAVTQGMTGGSNMRPASDRNLVRLTGTVLRSLPRAGGCLYVDP